MFDSKSEVRNSDLANKKDDHREEQASFPSYQGVKMQG
jgi:hypothetical protein